MAAQIETERKFLVELPVRPEIWTVPNRLVKITQAYLAQERVGAVERIRSQEDDGSVSLILCMKEHLSSGSNRETEVTITPTEYLALQERIDPQRSMIKKERYVFNWAGRTFELDIFSQPSVPFAMLEVELGSIDEEVELPPFLQIVQEVTGDPAFSNHAIAKGLWA